MPGRELSCQELVELVTDYSEGAMGRRQRRRFERHLSACDGCSAYIEQMQTLIGVTGQLRESDVPRELMAPLMQGFREWRV